MALIGSAFLSLSPPLKYFSLTATHVKRVLTTVSIVSETTANHINDTFFEPFVLSRRHKQKYVKSWHWTQTKIRLLSTVSNPILQTGILNVTWFVKCTHFDSASRGHNPISVSTKTHLSIQIKQLLARRLKQYGLFPLTYVSKVN